MEAVNNAPNTPQSITCANPIELTPNNTCSLTAATTPDGDGNSVTYVIDATSTCSNATVTNATTGAASYTAPAKNATCTVKIKAYDGVLYSSSASTTVTGYGWTQVATGVNILDHSLVASSDGLNLTAVRNDHLSIYTSTDAGSTWSARQTAAGTFWWSVATDSTGLKLIAFSDCDQILGDCLVYRSTDAFVSNSTSLGGFSNQSFVASSLDGEKLLINTGSSDGPGSYSTNHGQSWTQSAQSNNFSQIGYLNNGTIIAGVDEWYGPNDGKFSYSTNDGATWTHVDPSGALAINVFAGAATSNKVIIAGDGGRVYTGVYSAGAWTWTQRTISGTPTICSLASSANGEIFAAGESVALDLFMSQLIRVLLWTKTTSAPTTASWYNIVMSQDGSSMTAVNYTDGKAYRLSR